MGSFKRNQIWFPQISALFISNRFFPWCVTLWSTGKCFRFHRKKRWLFVLWTSTNHITFTLGVRKLNEGVEKQYCSRSSPLFCSDYKQRLAETVWRQNVDHCDFKRNLVGEWTDVVFLWWMGWLCSEMVAEVMVESKVITLKFPFFFTPPVH